MSFPTAGKAMQNLVSIGIARELTGQRRNRVFVYDAYLGILNEGGQLLWTPDPIQNPKSAPLVTSHLVPPYSRRRTATRPFKHPFSLSAEN